MLMNSRILIMVFFMITTGISLRAQGGNYASFKQPGRTVFSNSADNLHSDLVVNVDLVNVPFCATDKKGHWITSVEPTSIRVFEDNQRQTIQSFSKETDLPLNVGILLDNSNSVASRFSFQQDTARDFLASIIKPGIDQVFLMSFNSEMTLHQDFTDNPILISNALSQIHPQGFTRMNDAIIEGGIAKLAEMEGKKALIIISDGDDNASLHSLRQVIKAAQKSDIMIYSVSTKPHRTNNKSLSHAEKDLSKIAQNTGGTPFFPAGPEEFAASFMNIAEELRSQFTLAYSPKNLLKDGTYRRIKVETDQKELSVKAKRGYYAPSS
jgi:Ca-activated chloride channel family protein